MVSVSVGVLIERAKVKTFEEARIHMHRDVAVRDLRCRNSSRTPNIAIGKGILRQSHCNLFLLFCSVSLESRCWSFLFRTYLCISLILPFISLTGSGSGRRLLLSSGPLLLTFHVVSVRAGQLSWRDQIVTWVEVDG